MREDYVTTDLAGAAAWQRHNAPAIEADVDYADDLPTEPHPWHEPGTCWGCDAVRAVRAIRGASC